MKIKRSKSMTYAVTQDKEKRNLAILDLVMQGAVSRTQISKDTGINIMSVSNYVNNFIEKKILLEKGLAASSGGRKAELIELSKESNFVIGVEIGRSDIRVVVTDIGMAGRGRSTIARERGKEGLAKAVKAAEEIVAKAGLDEGAIRAIGIAADEKTGAAAAQAFEKRFGKDSYTAGPAVCAAIAERQLNPQGKGERFLAIYSSTGSGVLFDGHDCYGPSGSIGMGEIPPSAQEGSGGISQEKLRYLAPWNDYLGIVETACREVEKGVGTKIVSVAGGKIEKITEDVVIESARQKDEVALNILESVAINLGVRTAYLINLLQPDAVVICGGPEKAGDTFFVPLKNILKKLSLRDPAQRVKVVPGILGEDAVATGAALIAVREMFIRA